MLATSARAEAQESLRCAVDDGGGITCVLDASEQFDQGVREILESGFTNNLVYRFFLFASEEDEPEAVAVMTFASVFRLYTDVHYISREGTEGYVERNDWESAARELSQLEVPFENLDELQPGRYFAAVILEINPVSEAELLEARRWIARSRGAYRLFGETEVSFFGTFVTLFVDADPGGADARRLFRSEPFEVGP